MADLNKIKNKLDQQRSMGVDLDGRMEEANPNNKGDKPSANGVTTLEPNRFYIS
jgi:hypothetical protein